MQSNATRQSLLAVRIAGASFHSPFNLRSVTMGVLLDLWLALRRRLSQLRLQLIDELYGIISRESDRSRRRKLLQAKRDLFNGRRPRVNVDLIEFEFEEGIAVAFAEYSDLISREESFWEERQEAVRCEIRQRLDRLLEEPCFVLACEYSSPDLMEALKRGSDIGGGDIFAPRMRGLYSYAARFFSKANPFHVFASVIFPPSTGIRVEKAHEIVLDTGLGLEFEKNLLVTDVDTRRVHVHLRPWTLVGDNVEFWVPAGQGLRIVSVRFGVLLQKLVAFFKYRHETTGIPTATFQSCAEHLMTAPYALVDQEAFGLLVHLAREDVLARYLVTDFRFFGQELMGISPSLDPILSKIQRFHLALVAPEDLAQAHRELDAIPVTDESAGYIKFYVNSYDDLEVAPHQQAAEEVGRDLLSVKPFFCLEHNFSADSRLLKFYAMDFLRESDSGSASLLEVLRGFLRNRKSIIAKYREVALEAPSSVLQSKLCALSGYIESGSLAKYMPVSSEQTSQGVCFNGTFDYVRRRFYVANAFSGQGRFSSRFLLQRQRATEVLECSQDQDSIQVELAVQPVPSLNLVVRALDVGCGIEARYAHGFRRWIEPTDILLEMQGQDIYYRHRTSGERLSIQYRGFLLTQYLPTACQFLLLNHADSFKNPFQGDLPLESDIRYDPGLYYGSLCLRRPSWFLFCEDLWSILNGRDVLRSTALLREWFLERLGSPGEIWYYRLVESDHPKGRKPRMLDLFSPLSILALRRSLAVAIKSKKAVVALSCMEPPVEHLYHSKDSPYFTELMIEVC